MLPTVQLIEPKQQAHPFDSDDWVFELKVDGFRGVAYVEAGECRLVSRRGHEYERFGELCAEIVEALPSHTSILDGEIVCLDKQGRSRFYELMNRRGRPYFYAFDLLWLDGEDLREKPLLERKALLKEFVPAAPSGLLYLDYVEASGVDLFDTVCGLDLEGIVAKRKDGAYAPTRGGGPWVKVKNPSYSQAVGRGELFNKKRA